MNPTTDGQMGATDGSNGVRTSVFLQPIAAPLVLGYFAGGCGFLLFGVWLVGDLGAMTAAALGTMPFLFMFAGIAQLAAGLWSVRARDPSHTSLFTAWGGFWIGYTLLWFASGLGTYVLPAFAGGFAPLGMVMVLMAGITWSTAFAALARSPLQFLSQVGAAIATSLAAVALFAGPSGLLDAAAWIFVATSALYYYNGLASMINALYGRVVFPYFTWRREENVLGAHPFEPIQFPESEPGVKVGE